LEQPHESAPARRGRSGTWLPFLVLGAALGLTALLTWSVARTHDADVRRRFEATTDELQRRITSRVEAYLALLRGGAAFFAASEDVDHLEFRTWVERLRLAELYGGVQGVGYSVRIDSAARADLELQMQRSGFTDFRIHPPGPRPEMHAIIHLQPLDERNRAAIGYDMFTEEIRRDAMVRARDGGTAALSGPVRLVQEIDPANRQPGFLIYVPVYRGDDLPTTLDDRRARLLGFVYSPFRAYDLFDAVFGIARPAVDVDIHDGIAAAPEGLLYRSARTDQASPDGSARLATSRRIDLAGRTWTIAVAARPGFDTQPAGRLTGAVALGGTMVALLLFALTHRESAARLAAEHAGAAALRSRAAQDESEARKGAIIESAIDCIITADHEGRITEFNPAAERTFGWARPEIIGRSLVDTIIPPHLREAHDSGFNRYLSTRRPQIIGRRIEMVAARKDGSEFPVEIGLTATGFRGQPVFTAHVRDITARKQAEEVLRESEQRFRNVADTAPVMIWIAGTDRLRTFVNKVWLEFRGHTMDQEMGNAWLGGVHPEDANRCRDHYGAAFDARVDFEIEYRLLRHDGVYRWIVDQGIPRFTPAGEFLGYIGSCVDITNRKVIEEELERRVGERTEALDAATLEMEALSGSVSRDLDPPLAAIEADVRALLDHHAAAMPPEAVRLIESARAHALEMRQLVDDLVAFSRLGRSTIQRRRVETGAIVQTVIARLPGLNQDRRVDIVVGDLPACFADPDLLELVFANLLDNALRSTRNREVARIEVGCNRFGSRPTFFVRDNGMSMAARFTASPAAPFQRLHASDPVSGTGVGLALVNRILQRHGGRVWAESEPDAGATFFFQIGATDHDGNGA